MQFVSVVTVGLLLLVTGCAKYEYDLIEPAEQAKHIGRSVDAAVELEPILYRLRTVDNRLVLRAYNNTTDPIELLGDKSVVVDPDGQSHPLRGQTIAANSFIKLILPPPRPRVYNTGPTFGVGVGYGISSSDRPRRHHSPYDPPLHEPRYATVYDEADTAYWDWRGTGQARLTLVYRQGDQDFRHKLIFRRVKM